MNAFDPPVSSLPPTLGSDAEAKRKQFLNHEASVQSIGLLYLIGAVATLCGAAGNFFKLSTEGAVMSVLMVLFAVVYFWLGLRLRKLDPVARIPAIVLACLGLFAFPIGTLVNAYVLYLLLSAKGKMVFSPAYREVIAATPHIKYRMSIIIKIFLMLVIAMVVMGLCALLFAPRR